MQSPSILKSFIKIALACLLHVVPLNAFAEVPIPVLQSPVIDEARFFSGEEFTYLDTRLRNLYHAGGPQLVVWTLQGLDGEDIASLSIRAVDQWKLGHEKKDDGLLLLIAKLERRTRLEVGKGLEGVIPDILANRILQTTLKPYLKSGENGAGVAAVISRVEELVGFESSASAADKEMKTEARLPNGFLVLIFILVFILLPFLNRLGMFGGGRRFGRRNDTWFGGGGFGGFGGRGGGGGGFGGGGGGFSGGGSSGDW